MDEDQLAELELHLAAGTDIPTALVAVQRDQEKAEVRKGGMYGWAMLAVMVAALLYLLIN